jgi:hypothetical protein
MTIGDKLFDYARDVYGQRLEVGLTYQDFVLEQLHRRGIVLQPYSSKEYQRKAENMLGLEVKLDRKYAASGNLYIETHERSHPSRPELVPSGIYREDQCWLYGIGDFTRLFVFGKRCLQRIVKKASLQVVPGCRSVGNDTKTSKGVLISDAIAREYAERIFEFEGGK